jgi:hypothetical protein
MNSRSIRSSRRRASRERWSSSTLGTLRLHKYNPRAASKVIGGFEAVRDPQMSAERLRAKPALEANHIILLDRASDRNRRVRRLLRWRCTPESGKRAMHVDNQPGSWSVAIW